MIDKKNIILETIIKEYIKNPAPVSSKHLQSKLSIKISSATIRNYFKKMVNEGKLEQLHISSGRIPTYKTLKDYWRKRLEKRDNFEIENQDLIKKSSKEFNIFCEYKFFESNPLGNIINYKNRYIILEFKRSQFILDYSEPLFRFFNEFKGSEIGDLAKICLSIGLTTLSKKLNLISNEDISVEGIEELLELVAKNREWGSKHIKDILDGTMMENIKLGIHFEDTVPRGYLVYNSSAKIEEKDAKMLCIGHLTRDFENFFNSLKGV